MRFGCHSIYVLELGVFAKPLGIMSLSAKVSVPNEVERSSSGRSASKEESISAGSTQISKTNRQDRRARQNMVRDAPRTAPRANCDLYLFGYSLHYIGH